MKLYPCKTCGALPAQHTEPNKAWGRIFPGKHLLLTCPICGRTASGFAGIVATGEEITEREAAEIAAQQWNRENSNQTNIE